MSATARPGEAVTILGPAGDLQARLETPAGDPVFRAVVCHPHSLHGGSMDNKVVTTLTRTARNAGGVVLRVNFRGVGASAGEYDAGRGETGDMLAVWHWLAERYPALPGWLAGFSFGSYVAARGAGELRHADHAPAALLLVAPPVHHYGFDELPDPGCPVTVIQGDADEVVPAEQVRSWTQRWTPRPELIEFADTGHFFHGRLGDLQRQVRPRLPGVARDS